MFRLKGDPVENFDDVDDTLSGAAIAIALLPPLCVVRVGLTEGELNTAGSALLLFLTNFLSILLEMALS